MGAEGSLLKFYDKLDMIEDVDTANRLFSMTAGNIYANIKQRISDIDSVFENSLNLMANAGYSTGNRVKIDIITGMGKRTENTDGVTGYDYYSTGILALKENEVNSNRTTAYFLGYLHTSFEFDDSDNNEEWVDSLELGGYNKYISEKGWIFRNDLFGRINFHNTERSIKWSVIGGKDSDLRGTYKTYNIGNNNIIGKEFRINDNFKITPYGALKLMYVLRQDFSENGQEALEVDGNDAFSIKPKLAVNLKTETLFGKTDKWKLTGLLDFGYEYELAGLNVQEKARVKEFEEDYHKLAKPENDKGQLNTRAAVGIEFEEKYGIFLSGEYMTGNNKEDYKAGIDFKVSF